MNQNESLEIILYLRKKKTQRANIANKSRESFARRVRTSDIRNRQLTQICELLKSEGMDDELIEILTRIKSI